MAVVACRVHLEQFEGPLDLLLHLIERQEIAITEISIAAVTEQYLEYISASADLDLALAGDYLVMAATLLRIKARTLVPQDPPVPVDEDDAEDVEAALVERLVEYRRYRRAAVFLDEQAAWRGQFYRRGPRPAIGQQPPPLPPDLTLLDLQAAMGAVVAREAAADPIPPGLPRQPRLSLARRMVELWRQLRAAAGRLVFQDVMGRRAGRGEWVAGFVAVLELVRRGRVRASQTALFGDIELQAVGRRGQAKHAGEAARRARTEAAAAGIEDGGEDL